VVQRTGWGKSLVYFLATKFLRDQGAGCTILISPLLSLMRNQIAAARRIGVRAETINSTNDADWPRIETGLLRDEIDVLLISPERLANDDFVDRSLRPSPTGSGSSLWMRPTAYPTGGTIFAPTIGGSSGFCGRFREPSLCWLPPQPPTTG